jgi:hypothetical protein
LTTGVSGLRDVAVPTSHSDGRGTLRAVRCQTTEDISLFVLGLLVWDGFGILVLLVRGFCMPALPCGRYLILLVRLAWRFGRYSLRTRFLCLNGSLVRRVFC